MTSGNEIALADLIDHVTDELIKAEDRARGRFARCWSSMTSSSM